MKLRSTKEHTQQDKNKKRYVKSKGMYTYKDTN